MISVVFRILRPSSVSIRMFEDSDSEKVPDWPGHFWRTSAHRKLVFWKVGRHEPMKDTFNLPEVCGQASSTKFFRVWCRFRIFLVSPTCLARFVVPTQLGMLGGKGAERMEVDLSNVGPQRAYRRWVPGRSPQNKTSKPMSEVSPVCCMEVPRKTFVNLQVNES